MKNVLRLGLVAALLVTFPLRDLVNYEPMVDDSLAARAEAEGRNRYEYLYDLLLEDNGPAIGVYLGANYIDGNLDVCRARLLVPNTVSGLSDAALMSL
jgi:N-acyl-D-aspartate/D-glutamate deacylase